MGPWLIKSSQSNFYLRLPGSYLARSYLIATVWFPKIFSLVLIVATYIFQKLSWKIVNENVFPVSSFSMENKLIGHTAYSWNNKWEIRGMSLGLNRIIFKKINKNKNIKDKKKSWEPFRQANPKRPPGFFSLYHHTYWFFSYESIEFEMRLHKGSGSFMLQKVLKVAFCYIGDWEQCVILPSVLDLFPPNFP